MPAAVAARRELLTVPSAEVAELVRQDPAGLFDLMREALGGAQAGARPRRQRRRLRHAGRPQPPGDRAAEAPALRRRVLARARRAAARDRRIDGPPPRRGTARRDDDEPRPPLRVEFAGGHRIAVETEAVVKRESILNTVGSLALILPLLFLVFRSLWLVAVGSLPSALSLLVVLGALGFTGAKLSAAATGAAAMLFGLGVDGVVLLYVAHRLALARRTPSADVPAAIAGPSGSMLLGMWTTAATFYGLMFVDFPSLQQLGRLLGHSMVVCGVLTLVMVPALLPRRPPRRPCRALLMPRLAALDRAPAPRDPRRRRASLTCVLGFAATASASTRRSIACGR